MLRVEVEVLPYRDGDAEELAARLRGADRDELAAAGHTDPLAAIRLSVSKSEVVKTGRVGGQMVGVFGLVRGGTLLAPYGIPWALGTPLVRVHRRAFAEASRRYIQAMLAAYPVLVNLVHAKNLTAVVWLKSVGFEIGPEYTHPATGEPFYFFRMSRDV